MFGIPPMITIHIDFPALDNYVAYLKAVDTSQRQIDAVTTQVQAITLALKQSGGRLGQTIASQKP